MENLLAIKASDLTELFSQLSEIRKEIKLLKENEEEIKAYTIQKTADFLNVHHCTVRKLIIKGKLFAKFIEGSSGKTIIPYWSIKKYLNSKENSNQ
ncbi:MAG: hypothetical protein H0W73_20725 [Bacteroidetes bacterium]|nr:hypothetical protein [Bacteroidota bacterium]